MYKPPALWFYRAMTYFPGLGYRGKILLTALVGLHIPLLVIVGSALASDLIDHSVIPTIIAIDLLATLGGGLLTLLALDQLLRPMVLAARGLHDYKQRGVLPELPDHYPGQGGQLMADVRHTLGTLDQAVQQLSNYDTVTNLPNRTQFQRALHQTLQSASSDQQTAVITFQINDFDRLLGTFGQDAGDRLLRTLARRLESMAASHWQLGRLESDCLALVRGDAADPELLTADLEICLKRLAAPVQIGQQTLNPSLRAGITLAPADGEDAETLIQHTFTALLTERSNTSSAVVFFSQETRAALMERHLLEQELHKALAEGQFQLHFQPVVDCQNTRVTGAEALIRWQHPEFGNIAPAQFLPVAEETGLMDEIGAWVIDTACRQLHKWELAGYTGLRLAVNLSARQFSDFGLIDRIGENLLRYDLPPGCLEVELTEAVATTDPARTHRLLEALRTMGVTVAIDNFGTGHASMSNLRQLPLDKLKIDREFVKTMATPAICQSLISLSKGLGLEVVAEGVETAEEMEMLRERGCELFQGYFFAAPLMSGEFTEFLDTSTWARSQENIAHPRKASTG